MTFVKSFIQFIEHITNIYGFHHVYSNRTVSVHHSHSSLKLIELTYKLKYTHANRHRISIASYVEYKCNLT